MKSFTRLNIPLALSFCLLALCSCQQSGNKPAAGNTSSAALVDTVRAKDEADIREQVLHFTRDDDAYYLNNSVVDSIFCLWNNFGPNEAVRYYHPIKDGYTDSIAITSYTSYSAIAEPIMKGSRFPGNPIFFLVKKEGTWRITKASEKTIYSFVKEARNKRSIILYADTPKTPAGVVIRFGVKKPRLENDFVNVCGTGFTFLKGQFFISAADNDSKKTDTLFFTIPEEGQTDSTYPGWIDEEKYDRLKIDTNFLVTKFFLPFDSTGVENNKLIYRLMYDYNWADYCVKFHCEVVYDTLTHRLYQRRQKDKKLWVKKAPSEEWLRAHLP
jgi:hypothetical protein